MNLPLDASAGSAAEDCLPSEPVVVEDTLVSSPVLDVPPRGQMLSDSHKESAVVFASPGFHGSLSSEAWVAEAAKV